MAFGDLPGGDNFVREQAASVLRAEGGNQLSFEPDGLELGQSINEVRD